MPSLRYQGCRHSSGSQALGTPCLYLFLDRAWGVAVRCQQRGCDLLFRNSHPGFQILQFGYPIPTLPSIHPSIHLSRTDISYIICDKGEKKKKTEISYIVKRKEERKQHYICNTKEKKYHLPKLMQLELSFREPEKEVDILLWIC